MRECRWLWRNLWQVESGRCYTFLRGIRTEFADKLGKNVHQPPSQAKSFLRLVLANDSQIRSPDFKFQNLLESLYSILFYFFDRPRKKIKQANENGKSGWMNEEELEVEKYCIHWNIFRTTWMFLMARFKIMTQIHFILPLCHYIDQEMEMWYSVLL